MTIQVGDRIPDAKLGESIEFGEACPVSPAMISVAEATKGKKVVMFGLPGAYTPTCSAKHVPGFLTHLDALKKKGVDEVWCLSVNDGYVMAAWGRDVKGIGKLRFLGDGNADFARALGIDNDLNKAGMGVRMKRFSMLVNDGVVEKVFVEEPGKFEASTAEAMLASLA